MVTALVNDLARLPGVAVKVVWDFRQPRPDLPAQFLTALPGECRDQFWARILNGCDAVWPIAPESDETLEKVSRTVQTQDRVLIGSTPEAVRTAASKRAAARALEAEGVAVVPTRTAREGPPASDTGWVLKPDKGEGGVNVRFLATRAALEGACESLSDPGEWVVQPFVPGQARSLSLVVGGEAPRILSRNRQHVTFRAADARLDGVTPGPPPQPGGAWSDLLAATVRAIPGLWGYVGMDYIETEAGPAVLEVNPRLTSAYPALGREGVANPAQAILHNARRQADGGPVAEG